MASLNNIAEKLTTNDSRYLQSIKQEYYLLIRERTGEKIVLFSFFLFMVLFSNHNLHDHSNILLEEFIVYLGRSRTQRETFLGYVKDFFQNMFHTKELRHVFFKHVRPCCRKKMLVDLLTCFDEIVLNIVKQHELSNIFDALGIEELLSICNWYFDLAPDFYPWVEYEYIESRFTFEYHGTCEALVSGFTSQLGQTRKTITHDHRRFTGRMDKVPISYGIEYQPIEIETRKPIIKSRNTRVDLCTLREFLERDFWKLKRFLNYNRSTQYTGYTFNNTFTTEHYELFFFPQNV